MKFNRRFSKFTTHLGYTELKLSNYKLNSFVEFINYINYFNHNAGKSMDFLYTTKEPYLDLKVKSPVGFKKNFEDYVYSNGENDGTE